MGRNKISLSLVSAGATKLDAIIDHEHVRPWGKELRKAKFTKGRWYYIVGDMYVRGIDGMQRVTFPAKFVGESYGSAVLEAVNGERVELHRSSTSDCAVFKFKENIDPLELDKAIVKANDSFEAALAIEADAKRAYAVASEVVAERLTALNKLTRKLRG